MAELTEKEVQKLQDLAEEFLHATRREAKLTGRLGAGASAAVFELTENNQRRALKVYDAAFLEGARGNAERRRLKLQEQLIGHPCCSLVQLRQVAFHGKTCFVEMEHVGGFDLNQVLKDVPRTSIQPLVHQLVTAVRFLESVGLAHRDIKPANIRVSGSFDRLKLLDLGVVRELDYASGPDGTEQAPRKPFIATAQYSSPEYLFWLQPPSKDLWHALSVYQVGAVLHDLIMRRPLFADEVATENRYALAMAVLQKVPVTHAEDVPMWLSALSARCLTKEMSRRVAMISWDDFQDASDRVSSTLRRVQQIRKLGITSTDDGISQNERTLRREALMSTLIEQLDAHARAEFEGCPLERIPGSSTRTLVLRIPNTLFRIDFTVDFRWSDITREDTAAVFTVGQLRPEKVEYRPVSSVHDVCSLTPETVATAVDALLVRFIEQVGAALDIIETSDSQIAAAVILDQGST